MTYEEKKRWTLLWAFLQADKAYQEVSRQSCEADLLLQRLERELPKEQADMLRKIVHAYAASERCVAELACKYMVFPGELK